MANLPEFSCSISYTSHSFFSNGSSNCASSTVIASGDGSGCSGSSDSAKDLETVSLNRLSSSLERLLVDTEFDCTDAEIEVEGSTVGVHRCILAARSAFFLDLFSRKSSRKGSSHGKPRYSMAELVPAGHVGYEAFKDFLWYVYTGKLRAYDPAVSTCVDTNCAHDACRPAINFAVELMRASYTFQIEELILLMQRRLRNFVEKAYVEDVIPILLVAAQSQLDTLIGPCNQSIARSDLCEISLQKELPFEYCQKIKSIRAALHKSQTEESLEPHVDTGYEKRVRRIHRALDSDDVELVKMLLDESVVTLDDVNALHYTAAYCDSKVVAEVLELGLANVNLKNDRGYTPLHVAAMRREPTVIMSLLRKGAFASELTKDGRTALSICKRLTRPKDNDARAEQGTESNKYRICIEILEREMRRNPMEGDILVSSPSSGDNLQVKLQYLEDRVTLAKLFFPTEAKYAMQIAETAAKYSLYGSKDSSGNLKEVDLNETPERRNKRLRLKMEALIKTVELGKRYFPHCSKVLDKFMEDDLSDLFYLELEAPEQDLKRRRYHEIKGEVLEAFDKDKACSGLSFPSSPSPACKGDKRQHRAGKK